MDNTVGSLTEEQKSILFGTLLGDGSLRRKVNTLLEINHSFKQQSYVDWLYSKFDNLTKTSPKIYISGKNRNGYRFTTLSIKELNQFHDLFYVDKKKVIPKDIVLNSLSLAVWFMDDGSRSRSSVYLNTQQFSDEDQLTLMEYLSELNIEARVNKDKIYKRLRVTTETVNNLVKLVYPHIHSSMLYKLPL